MNVRWVIVLNDRGQLSLTDSATYGSLGKSVGTLVKRMGKKATHAQAVRAFEELLSVSDVMNS